MKKEIIQTDKAPPAVGPYNQAARAGDWLYVSGQIGLDPGTVELVGDDIDSQTRQAFTNLRSVLEAAGASLDTAVKITCFLDDMGHYARVNEIYAEFFDTDFPARSCFEVARLPKGAKIELEAVAFIP